MMERLTIDEVIEHCKRHTERMENHSGRTQLEETPIGNSNIMKQYWEHRQVAEWLEELKAYKDAEEQGLLLRLPCKVGDTVWTRKFATRIDEEDGTEWTICDIKRATVVPAKFNLFMLAKWGDLYFLTKEEAEKKLAEMGKEQVWKQQ